MENKKYNRKLQYNELIFEDGKEGSKKIVLTEQEAINIQKEKLKSMSYVYMNDETALLDFIAVNWASYVDEIK